MQVKTSLAALAAIVLLNVTPSLAQSSPAAAPWPLQAQGRTLPRPEWVLAIPARRAADGTLTIWDRSDEWTSAWRVPKTVDGLRIVTLLGDTEDRRAVTPAAIDGMLVDEMGRVMQKYDAPALALVVTDGSAVAVAGYVPGWSASWEHVELGQSIEEGHGRALSAIGTMFSEAGGTAAPQAAPSAAVTINAYRNNPDTGGMDYRIAVHGRWEQINAVLDAIAAMPGSYIVSEQQLSDTEVAAEIQRAAGMPLLEDDLARYGIPLQY